MELITNALIEHAVTILGAIATAAVGLVAVYARELALRSQARQAAIKAELEAGAGADGSSKLLKAIEHMQTQSSESMLLKTSQTKQKSLIEKVAKEAGEFVKSTK